MDSRTTWLDINGKKILKIDFSNVTNLEELKEVITQSENVHFTQEKGSVLRVTCIAGSYFTNEAKKELAEHAKRIEPYTRASACVGFTGIKAIIVKAINPKIKNFPTIEDACEWLVAQ